MENIALIKVVQDHYVGHSKVFLDRQGHLGEVLCHLEAFGTIRNAREASGAQRCECFLNGLVELNWIWNFTKHQSIVVQGLSCS